MGMSHRMSCTSLLCASAAASLYALCASGATYWLDSSVETSGDGLSREAAFKTWNEAWYWLGSNLSDSDQATLNVVARPAPYVLTATPAALPGKQALAALRGVNEDGTPVEDPSSVVVDGQGLYQIAPLGGDVRHLTVSGITFRNGKGTGATSGVYDDKGGPAGLFAIKGSMYNIITNCVFAGCTNGVAVFMSGEDNTIVDCTFRSNVCESANSLFMAVYGGGEHLGTNRLLGCTFEGNGDIALGTSAVRCDWSAEVGDCVFRANSANSSHGVALSIGGMSPRPTHLTSCLFEGNTNASVENRQGGVVTVRDSTQANLRDCTFRGNVMAGSVNNWNQKRGGCGIAFTSRGPHVLSGCLFEGNGDGRGGGCLIGSWDRGDITLVNCTMNTNDVGTCIDGGRIDGGSFTLEDCMFRGNRCQALLNIDASGSTSFFHVTNAMSRCVFDANVMTDNSSVRGAVCGAVLSLDACTFTDNVSWRSLINTGSGHVEMTDARFMARNCLFAGNETNGLNVDGGGSSIVFMQGTNADSIVNCTFATNSSLRGAIAHNTSLGSLQIINTIMSGNSNQQQGQPAYWRATQVDRCFLDFTLELAPKDGCVVTNSIGGRFANPGFADASNGDYALAKGSICRNAGDNSPWLVDGIVDVTATDLRGNPRICEADGGIVDVGCYEYTRIKRGFMLSVR